MSIKYNPEFLQLINELSQINKKIIIERDEEVEKIVVKRKNEEKYMAYNLEAPYDYFDIEGQIGIYDYVDFFKFFKTTTNPVLSIAENKLVMAANGSKINYILAEPASLKTGPKKVNFTKIGYKLKLDKDTLDEINKIQGLVKPRYASFTCTDGKIVLKLFNVKDSQETSFEKEFECETFDGAEDVEFNIYADVFEKIPKRDYEISIQCPGHMRFSLVDENMNLDIYTGRTKSN